MTYVNVIPDAVVATGGSLADLGSALRVANTAAASQTTAIAAPAADEVSAAVTALFGSHAQEFQQLSAQAAAFHDELVNLLNGGAAQYLSTDVANAQGAARVALAESAQFLLGDQFGPLGWQYVVSSSNTTIGGNFGVSLVTPFGSFPLLSTALTGYMNGTGQPVGALFETNLLSGYVGGQIGNVPYGSGNHIFADVNLGSEGFNGGGYTSVVGPDGNSLAWVDYLTGTLGPIGPTGVAVIGLTDMSTVPYTLEAIEPELVLDGVQLSVQQGLLSVGLFPSFLT